MSIRHDPLRYFRNDEIAVMAERLYVGPPESEAARIVNSMIHRLQMPDQPSAYAAAQD